MDDEAGNDPGRVAVIVVHGVADQVAGSTARSVVELLVASSPSPVSYEAIATSAFTIEVPPLLPTHPPDRQMPVTPTGETRPLSKSFAQSFVSDLHRADWEVPASTKRAARPGAATSASLQSPADTAAATDEPDRGLQVTNFLLSKFAANHGATEAYASDVVTLRRTTADRSGPRDIDVYEMYWADLSRLSGAIPRIITELFTLVFRLSKLGRGTVDEALGAMNDENTKAPAGWRWLAFLQTGLDWAFVNLLALLFTQLGMLALVIVPFALAAPHEDTTRWVVGIGVAGIACLWAAYRRKDHARRLVVPLALLGVALALSFVAAVAPWLVALLWLALLTVVLDAALRVSDDRFPFTRASGLALWELTVIGVVAYVAYDSSPASLTVWVQAALFGVELVLTAIKWWWIGAAFVFAAWYVAGWVASRDQGYEASASVDTGRLGMFASLGAFVMLTMALWALASAVLNAAVASSGVVYVPQIFPIEENMRGVSEAAARAAAAYSPTPAHAAAQAVAHAASAASAASAPDRFAAANFLRFRYEDSTAAFSVVAALLLLLVSYLVVVFLPSVLAELKILTYRIGRWSDEAARDLGHWLTAGYRHLGGAVSFVVFISIIGAIAVAFALYGAGTDTQGSWDRALDVAAWLSQVLLKPLVLGAAGVAAALSAFGGVLSRYVPGLRAPLDIALDVDNHFREFPRTSIPRARIFSRYAALLAHVSRQGYGRIVVVSHSQGTVISAELLRFLSDAPKGAPRAGHDRCAQLRAICGAEVRLVTLGCPLRQLYAARFPSLYGWVLRRNGNGNGPAAADIGVVRWANGYTSGDYVGRWLWSSPGDGDPIGRPMIDTLDPIVLGRVNAYARFDPMPPDAQKLAAMSEFELCVGFGAHTHYFEPDQALVAWLIEEVVAT
jgi:hypothetical protein